MAAAAAINTCSNLIVMFASNDLLIRMRCWQLLIVSCVHVMHCKLIMVDKTLRKIFGVHNMT